MAQKSEVFHFRSFLLFFLRSASADENKDRALWMFTPHGLIRSLNHSGLSGPGFTEIPSVGIFVLTFYAAPAGTTENRCLWEISRDFCNSLAAVVVSPNAEHPSALY